MRKDRRLALPQRNISRAATVSESASISFIVSIFNCSAETEKLAFTDEERADLEKDGEEANMKMGKITIEKKEDVRLIILGVYDCSKSTDVTDKRKFTFSRYSKCPRSNSPSRMQSL